MYNQIVKINYHKNIEKFFKEETDKREENFYISGFIATTHIDTTNDKITKEALEKALKYIKENEYFTVLFNHDVNRPIGKIVDLELKELEDGEYGLYVTILISKTEKEIIQKIEEGILNKFSIGAYGVVSPDEEKSINWIKDLVIFECSLVSVPANPKASLTNYFIKEISREELETMEEERKIMIKQLTKEKDETIKIRINKTDIDYTPWSSIDKIKLKNMLMKSGDKKAIRECFGIVRSYERMGDWKFPHHVLKKKEENLYELILSYTGLIAAYQAFRGARVKPNITSEEKEKLRRHLLKHFRYLVRIGEYEEIPEGLRKYLDISEITKETWLEEIKQIILDLENIGGYTMSEKDLKDIEMIEELEVTDKTLEIEIEEKEEEEEKKQEEEKEEEYLDEKFFEDDEEYNDNENNEENEDNQNGDDEEDIQDNEKEEIMTEEELRQLIREEVTNALTFIVEKIDTLTDMIAKLEERLEKSLKRNIFPKAIEIEEKKEDDFDLTEVINLPEYKRLSTKEQLQVLRILFDLRIPEEVKKQEIKNLLKIK